MRSAVYVVCMVEDRGLQGGAQCQQGIVQGSTGRTTGGHCWQGGGQGSLLVKAPSPIPVLHIAWVHKAEDKGPLGSLLAGQRTGGHCWQSTWQSSLFHPIPAADQDRIALFCERPATTCKAGVCGLLVCG